MTSFKVLVVDVNGKPLEGKVVKACKQGFDKTCYRVTTDANGVSAFSITALQETVELSVEGLTTGTNTVNVDIWGNPSPDFVTIRTTFQPLSNLGTSLGQIGDYFKGLGTIATVIIAIVIAIILFLVIRKALSSGKVSIPNPVNIVKGVIKK